MPITLAMGEDRERGRMFELTFAIESVAGLALGVAVARLLNDAEGTAGQGHG